jgi:hypothetical protein
MSRYARAAVKIIVDAAHCDGMITTLGVGRDWTADEPRNTLALDQRTPDVGGMYGWWYEGVFEHITKLNCIAPIMTYAAAPMELGSGAGQWAVNKGLWRQSAASGVLGVMGGGLLEYYDGRPGRYAANAWGQVTSVDELAPNMQVYVWRMPGSPLETEAAAVEFILEGATSGEQFCIGFPSNGDAGIMGTAQGRTGWQSHPYLMGKRTGDTYWTVLDHLNVGCAPGNSGPQRKASLLALRIEYLDGALLVRTDKQNEPWVFCGQWLHNGDYLDFALADTGNVTVNITGHPGLVGVWPLQAPATADLYPRAFYIRGTDPPESNSPLYRLIGSAPTGTTLSVAVDVNGGDSDQKRPKVTFAASDRSKRAALYNVQEYRLATIGGADSDPVELTSGEETFRTLTVSGHVDRSYKGATVDIDYICKPGYVLNEIRPNAKVGVSIGAMPEGDAITWHPQFVGYALPPKKRRHEGQSEGHVSCADMASARLRKKCMGWHCSYEGWPVDDAFEHILNRAGVPPGLIGVDEAISFAEMGALYYLPTSIRRGRRKLCFGPQVRVPSALDEICRLRCLEWGITPLGIAFLRRYEPMGLNDVWTVSEAGTAHNMIHDFRHTRSTGDFVNLLQVMVGEGVAAAARVMHDDASWSDAAVARFIGDLWTRYDSYPSGDDLNSIAVRIWDEVVCMDSLVSWTEYDRPSIMPGDGAEVYVDASLNIVQGSVYRILDKRWGIREDGRYWQTLEADLKGPPVEPPV